MTPVQCELAVEALSGLLNEFRHGNIVARSAEENGMQRHAGPLSAGWNKRFPGFPINLFPYTSFRGEFYRKHRDAHLKDIIVQLLAGCGGETTIVNPACVFGRHACHLAARLPRAKVIATDIDMRYFLTYRAMRLGSLPGNYSFVKDNIFDPQLKVQPTAVVFFGACGAVSDGALDYAIVSGARQVMCRTCCHENIGGNVTVAARPNAVNRFFRFKNRVYDRVGRRPSMPAFTSRPNMRPAPIPEVPPEGA